MKKNGEKNSISLLLFIGWGVGPGSAGGGFGCAGGLKLIAKEAREREKTMVDSRLIEKKVCMLFHLKVAK
jgi:hypothetical protein